MPPENSLENLLLQKIGASQQANGIFLSRRFHLYLPVSRTDDNVFFSSSILFLLELYRGQLSPENQRLVDEICRAGIAGYPLYQNKHGLETYNFYRTNPSGHFPNGQIMRRLSHFELPDDADCTALIYLTKNSTTEQVKWLHNKLPQHANLTKLQVQTTLPEARNLAAYSTWFGQNMPIEFDACVLSNLLFLFYQHQLPQNRHDEASLEFLRLVISSDAYFKNPYEVSPSYPSTAIVLYHIVRLVSRFEIPVLGKLREKLNADVERASTQTANFMERVLLDTCRMRLGGQSQLKLTKADVTRRETQHFAWFTAAFLSPFANPLLHWLAKFPLFQMKFTCPAMSYALLLEQEVNRKVRTGIG